MPRAYIVDRVFVDKQPLKVLERLSQLQFDPLRQVVLDHSVTIQPSESFEAQASIEQYENNSVTVQTTANHEGVLVLADSFYPGWKAFLDGNETNIFRANHFFRAVVLPKGAHRVEFKYEPWSFKLGWIISLFTSTGVIVASLCMFFRQRRLAARNPVRSLQILKN